VRGIARNIARDIRTIKFSIPETMSGKIKKWFHVARYRREKQAGSFRRDWLLLGILGFGNDIFLWGVGKGHWGVPVPVSNPSSNFIRQGYRYGNKTDV